MSNYQEIKKAKKNAEIPFDVEQWIQSISGFTFETKMIPMPREWGIAIIQHYDHVLLHHKDNGYSQETEKILTSIADAIDEVIKSFGSAVFVRLSTRSPKDAVLVGEGDVVKRTAAEMKSKGENLDLNTKLMCLSFGMQEALKVHSGKEAMALITNSERVAIDLKQSRDYSDKWEMNIIVRKWVDIPHGREFRGFVHKGQFNALSAYDNIICYPYIVKNKEAIAKKTRDLWEQFKDSVPMDSYVVDFAILSDETCVVVELNPFNNYEGAGTGASLFHWKYDEKVLHEGPFEFRIVEKPREDLERRVYPDWMELIEAAERLVAKEKEQALNPPVVNEEKRCNVM